MAAASRVSADKGQLSSDHISCCHDFILSLLQLEWVKSYRLTLCQHNYQMSSVTSFVFRNLETRDFSTVQNEIHRSGNRQIYRCDMSVESTHLMNFKTVIVF